MIHSLARRACIAALVALSLVASSCQEEEESLQYLVNWSSQECKVSGDIFLNTANEGSRSLGLQVCAAFYVNSPDLNHQYFYLIFLPYNVTGSFTQPPPNSIALRISPDHMNGTTKIGGPYNENPLAPNPLGGLEATFYNAEGEPITLIGDLNLSFSGTPLMAQKEVISTGFFVGKVNFNNVFSKINSDQVNGEVEISAKSTPAPDPATSGGDPEGEVYDWRLVCPSGSESIIPIQRGKCENEYKNYAKAFGCHEIADYYKVCNALFTCLGDGQEKCSTYQMD